LLLALSLSLFVCIIDRLPGVLRSLKVGKVRSANQIESLKYKNRAKLRFPLQNILSKLPRGFRYKIEEVGEEKRIVGTRGSFARLGPTLTHLGLLCLAIGGLTASFLGFTTRVQGLPGDIMENPGFDFKVRVDTFMIQYYPLGLGQWVLVDDAYIGKIIGRDGDDRFLLEVSDPHEETKTVSIEASRLKNQYDIEYDRGNIKDYITMATVLDGDREVGNYRIEVNHPLRYKGFRFYQTSFNTENARVNSSIDSALVVINDPETGEALDSMTVVPDVPYPLPDGSTVLLAQFFPDFRLEGSTPVSASATLRNPAVLLEVWKDGEELYHQWSFLRNPFVHTAPEAAYTFQVNNIYGFKGSAVFATILQVKKTPGTTLIWIGFIFSTLGLLLSFYVIPQKLFLVLKPTDDHHTEVVVGVAANKNPKLFWQRIERWIAHLKESSADVEAS
jgi:cytochrome c biogenesis protein